MFFEIDGFTYAVRIVRVGSSTFAELMKVKSNGELAHTDLVGEVRLYYKDTFNAQTGRKLALSRLLDKVAKSGAPLTKETREYIWTQFFDKYGK